MAGHPAVTAFRSYATVVLDDEIRRKSDGKVHFDRVFSYWHQDGRLHVRRGDAQASHQLSATAQTNALLEVPDGEGMKAGDTARALLFRPA
jgi:molybdopterin biosynthesis enzyme